MPPARIVCTRGRGASPEVPKKIIKLALEACAHAYCGMFEWGRILVPLVVCNDGCPRGSPCKALGMRSMAANQGSRTYRYQIHSIANAVFSRVKIAPGGASTAKPLDGSYHGAPVAVPS